MTPQIETIVNDLINAIRAEFVAIINGDLPTTTVSYFASPGVTKTITINGVATKKPRKKMPIQLCPVPRRKGRAAPVFGMVCAAHKGVAKSTIKAYRAARKAAKGG